LMTVLIDEMSFSEAYAQTTAQLRVESL
jgi:hypothetical protein